MSKEIEGIVLEIVDEVFEAEYETALEKLGKVGNKTKQVDSAVKKTVKDGEKSLASLKSKVVQTDFDVKRTVSKMSNMILRITQSVQNMLHAFGVALDPLWSAVFTTITTVASTLYSIATAQFSNPYTAALGVAIMIATGAMEVGATISAVTGQAQTEQMLNTSRVVLDNTMNMINLSW